MLKPISCSSPVLGFRRRWRRRRRNRRMRRRRKSKSKRRSRGRGGGGVGGGATDSLSHVLYIGISHGRYTFGYVTLLIEMFTTLPHTTQPPSLLLASPLPLPLPPSTLVWSGTFVSDFHILCDLLCWNSGGEYTSSPTNVFNMDILYSC